MIAYREFQGAVRKLALPPQQPIIAHASLSAFGEIQGGAETVLGALLASGRSIVMPTFTYRTMLTPEVGPDNNGLTYGSGHGQNVQAQFYTPQMPSDRLMGRLSETLRRHPKAQRSNHPILSFSGIGADEIIAAGSLGEPLGPIRALVEAEGWILLLGVDHTVNTSLHYAELLAGRKQFVRWALTPQGVLECGRFPGCSDGFQAIEPRLESMRRQVAVGAGTLQAFPIAELVETARAWIRTDPLALLCHNSYCERCEAVRKSLAVRL